MWKWPLTTMKTIIYSMTPWEPPSGCAFFFETAKPGIRSELRYGSGRTQAQGHHTVWNGTGMLRRLRKHFSPASRISGKAIWKRRMPWSTILFAGRILPLSMRILCGTPRMCLRPAKPESRDTGAPALSGYAGNLSKAEKAQPDLPAGKPALWVYPPGVYRFDHIRRAVPERNRIQPGRRFWKGFWPDRVYERPAEFEKNARKAWKSISKGSWIFLCTGKLNPHYNLAKKCNCWNRE